MGRLSPSRFARLISRLSVFQLCITSFPSAFGTLKDFSEGIPLEALEVPYSEKNDLTRGVLSAFCSFRFPIDPASTDLKSITSDLQSLKAGISNASPSKVKSHVELQYNCMTEVLENLSVLSRSNFLASPRDTGEATDPNPPLGVLKRRLSFDLKDDETTGIMNIMGHEADNHASLGRELIALPNLKHNYFGYSRVRDTLVGIRLMEEVKKNLKTYFLLLKKNEGSFHWDVSSWSFLSSKANLRDDQIRVAKAFDVLALKIINFLVKHNYMNKDELSDFIRDSDLKQFIPEFIIHEASGLSKMSNVQQTLEESFLGDEKIGALSDLLGNFDDETKNSVFNQVIANELSSLLGRVDGLESEDFTPALASMTAPNGPQTNQAILLGQRLIAEFVEANHETVQAHRFIYQVLDHLLYKLPSSIEKSLEDDIQKDYLKTKMELYRDLLECHVQLKGLSMISPKADYEEKILYRLESWLEKTVGERNKNKPYQNSRLKKDMKSWYADNARIYDEICKKVEKLISTYDSIKVPTNTKELSSLHKWLSQPLLGEIYKELKEELAAVRQRKLKIAQVLEQVVVLEHVD